MLFIRRSRREKEPQEETLHEAHNTNDVLYVEADEDNYKGKESSIGKSETTNTESYSDRDDRSSTSPFAASRAEWDTPTDTDTNTSRGFSASKNESANADETSSTESVGSASSTTSSSGVYSYSFRRSRKQNDMEDSNQDNSQNVSENKPLSDDSTNLDGEFSRMRNDFKTEEVVRTDIDNAGRIRSTKRKRSVVKSVQPNGEPGVVSTGSMAKWAFSIPLYVMKEIVVPTVQVGMVVWYDFKVWLSCMIGGRAEDDYFVNVIEEVDEDSEVDSSSGRTETEPFGMDEELSDEEMQLLELQRNAGKAMKQVEGVLRVVQGGVQKMWNDFK